jgi:putative transposase
MLWTSGDVRLSAAAKKTTLRGIASLDLRRPFCPYRASFIHGPTLGLPLLTRGGSPVRELRTPGSVRGVCSNAHPYRDRRKCRAGRPPIPLELRSLIRRMAAENPLWGEDGIANELLVKLGIRVSPRTVGKYMPKRPLGQPRGDERWSTFLKNHAKAILACDFFVAVTATFRMLYVFVVIEHRTRRLAHVNVTAHPGADWTLQQLREVVGEEGRHHYLIHDRDRIYAKHLDDSIRALGMEVLRSPVASPKANSICERVIGTIRRECLDWVIPLSEAHLRSILKSWVEHYNCGRPHSMLGPGVPDPPRGVAVVPKSESRHRLAAGGLVLAKSILGGLHHEYSIATLSMGG